MIPSAYFQPSLLPRIPSLCLRLLLAAALCCCAARARAQVSPPLHTAGQFIVDSTGKRVHINAVNWYGAESPDYVVAGLQSASLAAIVQQLKNLGFNAVRLPWSNQLYESNPVVPSYALAANPDLEGKTALAVLDQVVGAFTGAGILVILDNHNSAAEWCCGDDGNTLWYNSAYPEAQWLSDWQGIVGRYAANPLVAGADLRNEPRLAATWGGDPATDWHGAAERGGNAVLAVNPHMLVFVEGVNYALDLSGAAALPVRLSVANQLVYEPHDYGFDYSGLTGYSDYVGRITPHWGFLVTGANPAPVWLGEFGTCNSGASCVQSGSPQDNGYWFGLVTTYLKANDLDWSYWAINGTQSTGAGRTWGAAEGYGILNTSWNGSALPALTQALGSITAANEVGFTATAGGGVSIATPGLPGTGTVTITPQNGFKGMVNLSCGLTSSPANAVNVPGCAAPATVSLAAGIPVAATVVISTTGSGAARGLSLWGGAALACLLPLPWVLRRRAGWAGLVAVLAVALATSGCGPGGGVGQGGGSSTATTAGSYSFTVTATAAGQAPAAVVVAVTVQ